MPSQGRVAFGRAPLGSRLIINWHSRENSRLSFIAILIVALSIFLQASHKVCEARSSENSNQATWQQSRQQYHPIHYQTKFVDSPAVRPIPSGHLGLHGVTHGWPQPPSLLALAPVALHAAPGFPLPALNDFGSPSGSKSRDKRARRTKSKPIDGRKTSSTRSVSRGRKRQGPEVDADCHPCRCSPGLVDRKSCLKLTSQLEDARKKLFEAQQIVDSLSEKLYGPKSHSATENDGKSSDPKSKVDFEESPQVENNSIGYDKQTLAIEQRDFTPDSSPLREFDLIEPSASLQTRNSDVKVDSIEGTLATQPFNGNVATDVGHGEKMHHVPEVPQSSAEKPLDHHPDPSDQMNHLQSLNHEIPSSMSANPSNSKEYGSQISPEVDKMNTEVTQNYDSSPSMPSLSATEVEDKSVPTTEKLEESNKPQMLQETNQSNRQYQTDSPTESLIRPTENHDQQETDKIDGTATKASLIPEQPAHVDGTPEIVPLVGSSNISAASPSSPSGTQSEEQQMNHFDLEHNEARVGDLSEDIQIKETPTNSPVAPLDSASSIEHSISQSDGFSTDLNSEPQIHIDGEQPDREHRHLLEPVVSLPLEEHSKEHKIVSRKDPIEVLSQSEDGSSRDHGVNDERVEVNVQEQVSEKPKSAIDAASINSLDDKVSDQFRRDDKQMESGKTNERLLTEADKLYTQNNPFESGNSRRAYGDSSFYGANRGYDGVPRSDPAQKQVIAASAPDSPNLAERINEDAPEYKSYEHGKLEPLVKPTSPEDSDGVLKLQPSIPIERSTSSDDVDEDGQNFGLELRDESTDQVQSLPRRISRPRLQSNIGFGLNDKIEENDDEVVAGGVTQLDDVPEPKYGEKFEDGVWDAVDKPADRFRWDHSTTSAEDLAKTNPERPSHDTVDDPDESHDEIEKAQSPLASLGSKLSGSSSSNREFSFRDGAYRNLRSAKKHTKDYSKKTLKWAKEKSERVRNSRFLVKLNKKVETKVLPRIKSAYARAHAAYEKHVEPRLIKAYEQTRASYKKHIKPHLKEAYRRSKEAYKKYIEPRARRTGKYVAKVFREQVRPRAKSAGQRVKKIGNRIRNTWHGRHGDSGKEKGIARFDAFEDEDEEDDDELELEEQHEDGVPNDEDPQVEATDEHNGKAGNENVRAAFVVPYEKVLPDRVGAYPHVPNN